MNLIKDCDIVRKYGIVSSFSTIMSLASAELYSGNDNDPEIIGHMHAHDVVPKDFTGQQLPYEVVISMPVFPLNEGDAFEEMSHRSRMNRQKIKITVVVFRDMEGYEMYLADECYYCV